MNLNEPVTEAHTVIVLGLLLVIIGNQTRVGRIGITGPGLVAWAVGIAIMVVGVLGLIFP